MKSWILCNEQKVKDEKMKNEKKKLTYFINCPTPKNAISMDGFLVKM
jgi:hypothetical protein